MTAPVSACPQRCFGEFLLDVPNARLSRLGQQVEIAPKAFEVLAYLTQRPGELVLKDTLLDEVWGRRFVSEGAVKTVVSELRAALGDDARSPLWIQTVQRRGYRFVGVVQPLPVAATAAQVSAPSGLADRCGNLPLALPAALAREAEAAALDALASHHRLLTLTGPAGVGKTRLAMARAGAWPRPFADGVWLLELAPLAAETTDEARLRALLASTLHLDAAAAASTQALTRALQPLSLLLLIDNAEHLLRPLAPLLAQLHEQLPGLQLLVTSREPLNIAGEQVMRLAPLDVPSPADDAHPAQLMECGAVRLFIERVREKLPGFVLAAAQQRAVAALCRALDGLPLALELAAARVPLLGVNGLVEQLVDAAQPGARLQLLTRGLRTAVPHQRTLRATLDWSYALLSPVQQRVFRRLSVFRGGFTLASAQGVCADPELDDWVVLDALDALHEKCMLSTAALSDGAERFGQLESLREHGHEHLMQSGEFGRVSRRHLQAVCAHWKQADSRAHSDPALAWTTRHSPEIDNLRNALRWADSALQANAEPALLDELLALLGHTGSLWHRAGLAAEGASWCQAFLAQADRHTDPNLRGGVNLALATLSCYSLVLPPATGLALARHAASAFEQAGDAVREYFAHHLAWTLQLRAQPAGDRQAHIDRMGVLERPQWNAMLTRYGRATRAYERRLQGDHQAYLQYSREELALRRGLGAQWESWAAAHALMLAEHDLGQDKKAMAIGRELMDDIRASGRLRQNAMRVVLYMAMLAQSGDVAATRKAMPEALAVASGVGAGAHLQPALAWLALHEGRYRAAAQLLGCFDAPHRAGSHYGPGTYNRRSIDALGQQLQTRLGASDLALQRLHGQSLGDDASVSLGLAFADPDL